MGADTVLSDFLKERLEAQETRKSSLEAKGLAVISTAGGLSTVLFGLLAVATTREEYVAFKGMVPLVAVVASAFLASGVLGLATNLPLRYEEIDVADTLAKMKAHWADGDPEGRAWCTATRAKILRSARRVNDLKASLLLAALACETVAMLLVGVLVVLTVRAG